MEYVQKLAENKNEWAKCCLKESFAAGVSTTSRIEGLHGVLKRYLTSNSSLQEVFRAFRLLEQVEVQNFKEEFERHRIKPIEQAIDFLDTIKKGFSNYIFLKIFNKYFKALNYNMEKITDNSW